MRESGTKDQASDRVDTFQVGRYRVSLAAREVFLGEQRIKLSWRCFEAMELLVSRLRKSKTNAEFLMSMNMS